MLTFLKFFPARTIFLVFVLQFSGQTAPAATADSSFLGNEGTNVELARSKFHERKAVRLRWELATTLDAYNRIGTRSPRWDAAARTALLDYAKLLAGDCTNECEEELKVLFQSAVSAGCTDPLVTYFSMRAGCYPLDIPAAELARRYADAEEHLQASEYPPIRKCYASVRAAQEALRAAQTANDARAALLNSVPALLIRAELQFEHLLRDQSANRDSIYDLIEKSFLDVARDTPDGRTRVFEPLAAFFETNTAKIAGDAPGAGLIEGNFWVQSAWYARGYGWSSSVSGEGWKLFSERLEKAQAILEKAWTADPSDPNIAIQMMTVELGQGLGRERLETWFRRAMDADPDSCLAAHKKMVYLEPKWHGSREELFEFAEQCFATGNWKSRIPFVLISAHCDLADVSDQPSQYWKNPEVWNDVEKLYTAYLKFNPSSTYDRSHYALKAFRAEKWQLANELFTALGDKPDLKALGCSMAQYDRMRRTAALKVQTQ